MAALAFMDNAAAMNVLSPPDVGDSCTSRNFPIIAAVQNVNASYDFTSRIPPSLPQYMAHHSNLGTDTGISMWNPPSDYILPNVTACRRADAKYTYMNEIVNYDPLVTTPDHPLCNHMVCIPGPCTMLEIDYQSYSIMATDPKDEYSLFGIPACRAVWGRGMANQLSGIDTPFNVPKNDARFYPSTADNKPPYAWAPIDGTDDPNLIEWHRLNVQLANQCRLPANVNVNNLESVLSEKDTGISEVVSATTIENAVRECSPNGTVDSEFPFMTVWSNDAAWEKAMTITGARSSESAVLAVGKQILGSVNETLQTICYAPIQKISMFANVQISEFTTTLSDHLNKIPMELLSMPEIDPEPYYNKDHRTGGTLQVLLNPWNMQRKDTGAFDFEKNIAANFTSKDRADLSLVLRYMHYSCNLLPGTSYPSAWESQIVARIKSEITIIPECWSQCIDMSSYYSSDSADSAEGDLYLRHAFALLNFGSHSLGFGGNPGVLIATYAQNVAVQGYGVFQAVVKDDGNFACGPSMDKLKLTEDNTLVPGANNLLQRIGQLYNEWEIEFAKTPLEQMQLKWTGALNAIYDDGTDDNKTLVTYVQKAIWKYAAIRYGVCTPSQLVSPYYNYERNEHARRKKDSDYHLYYYYPNGPLWLPGTFSRENFKCCQPVTTLTRSILSSPPAESFAFVDGGGAPKAIPYPFDPGPNYYNPDDSTGISPYPPVQPNTGGTKYSFVCRLSALCNQITSIDNSIPMAKVPTVYVRPIALSKTADRNKAGNLPMYPLGVVNVDDPDVEKCGNGSSISTAYFGRHVIQGEAELEFNAVACSVWGYCAPESGNVSVWTPWDTSNTSKFSMGPLLGLNEGVIDAFRACCFCVTTNYIAPTNQSNVLYNSAEAYAQGNRSASATIDNSMIPVWGNAGGKLKIAPCGLPASFAAVCNNPAATENASSSSKLIAELYPPSGCIMTLHEFVTHQLSPCKKDPPPRGTEYLEKDIVERFFKVDAENGDSGIKSGRGFQKFLRDGRDNGVMETTTGKLTKAVMIQFAGDAAGHAGKSVFVIDPDSDAKPSVGDDVVFWLLKSNQTNQAPDPSDPCSSRSTSIAVSLECDSDTGDPTYLQHAPISVCRLLISDVWDQKMPYPAGCQEILYSATSGNLEQAYGESKTAYNEQCVIPQQTPLQFKPQNPCKRETEMSKKAHSDFAQYCNLNDGVFDWDSASTNVCRLADQHCEGPWCLSKDDWDDNSDKFWNCAPTSCGRLGYTQFSRGDGQCYALFAQPGSGCATWSGTHGTYYDSVQCEAWSPADMFRWCTDDTMASPNAPATAVFDKEGFDVPLYEYDPSNRTNDKNGAIFARCCDNGFTINPLVPNDKTWPAGYTTLQKTAIGATYISLRDKLPLADDANFACNAKTHESTSNLRSRKDDPRKIDGGDDDDTYSDGSKYRAWTDDFVRGARWAAKFKNDLHNQDLGDIDTYKSHTEYDMGGKPQIVYNSPQGACSSDPPTIKTLNDGYGTLHNSQSNWGAFLKGGGGSGQAQFVIDSVEWYTLASVTAEIKSPLIDGDVPLSFASATKLNMPGIAPFIPDASFKNAPPVPTGSGNKGTFFSNTVGKDSSYSCDCGRASPIYACGKFSAQEMQSHVWFGNYNWSSTVGRLDVDYMWCGWTWDQPVSSAAFTVGLYIPSGPGASTFQTIERDALGAPNRSQADVDLNQFYLDQGAPNADVLDMLINRQSGNANDFDPSPFSSETVTPRVHVVTYPGSCIRWPFGRLHRSMLGKKLADQYFAHPDGVKNTNGKYNGGLSIVGDEALYAYCEQTSFPENQYVFCNHDKMSLTDRDTWCKAHPEAVTVSVGAVMTRRLLDDACFNDICVFIPGETAWPSPTALWTAMGKPGVTIVVAPFSAKIAYGIQAGTKTMRIDATSANRPKTSVTDQLASHRFDQPVQHNRKDAVLAVDLEDLLAVASLKGLAAINDTVTVASVQERLTRLHVAAKSYSEAAAARATAAQVTGCASGRYTPPLGAFLGQDTHWENYACGTDQDFEPLAPPGQVVAYAQSTLVPGNLDTNVAFQTTAAQCTAITIAAPEFTAIGLVIDGAETCTKTGIGAIPIVFESGNNSNAVMSVTVSKSKTVAVAVVGYNIASPKLTDAIAIMNNSEIDIELIDQQAGTLGHIAAAVVHTMGSMRISCNEMCTVVVQDVDRGTRADILHNWAVKILDVTDMTSVFGTAFERAYFTPAPNHNALLLVGVVAFGLTTVGLLAVGAFARATPEEDTTQPVDLKDGKN